MVELQLQIVRESSTQSLGINILTVDSKNGKVVIVEKVATNCIAELGGLKVGDMLVSANGASLAPNPGLSTVVATMLKLPASFTITVDRPSADMLAAAAAAAATSSSSSGPGAPAKIPHRNGAASAARASAAAADGRGRGRPPKPMEAKLPPGPKPRPPNPRLTGSPQKDLQRARPAWRGAQRRAAADAATVVRSSDSSESERESKGKARGRPPGSKGKVGRSAGAGGGASGSSPGASDSSEAESEEGGSSSDEALLAGPWDIAVEGKYGFSDDDEGGNGAGLPATLPGWAAVGAAPASDTEVLLYALLVLLELGGCPKKVDKFTRAVDQCMEAHRQKPRKAHNPSGGDSSSSSSSEEEESERQVLGLAAAAREPGAWWTLKGSDGGLACAALSPKVTAILDRALRPAPPFCAVAANAILASGNKHGSGDVADATEESSAAATAAGEPSTTAGAEAASAEAALAEVDMAVDSSEGASASEAEPAASQAPTAAKAGASAATAPAAVASGASSASGAAAAAEAAAAAQRAARAARRARKEAWLAHARLAAAARALAAFPGRGRLRLLPRPPAASAASEASANGDGKAAATTEATTDATAEASETSDAATSSATHRNAPRDVAGAVSGVGFGRRHLCEYLHAYAAERLLTGGTANRCGPAWVRPFNIEAARNFSEAPTKKARTDDAKSFTLNHRTAYRPSEEEGHSRNGHGRNGHGDRAAGGKPATAKAPAAKASNVPAVCGPRQLRAHAGAARVATLLWEHGDSLWRALCRADRHQVLPLWERYDARGHETCAALAPALKVPMQHLVAVNAWRYPGLKGTSRFRPGSRIDFQPRRDTLNLRFLGACARDHAQQFVARLPRAAAAHGLTVALDDPHDAAAWATLEAASGGAGVYAGRGWVGRRGGLATDDVAARRQKASLGAKRAANFDRAANDRAAAEGTFESGNNNRDGFLAARRGGRRWRAWELEALQGAVRAFRSRRRNLDRVAELLGLGDCETPLGLGADGSTGGEPPFAALESGKACADLEESEKGTGGAEGKVEAGRGVDGTREGSGSGSGTTSLNVAAAATPCPPASLRDGDLVLAAAYGRSRARFVPAGALAALAPWAHQDAPSNAAGLLSSAGSLGAAALAGALAPSAGGTRGGVAFVCTAGTMQPGSNSVSCFCARGGTKPVVRVNPLGQVIEKYCSCATAAAQHGFTLKHLAAFFRGTTETCQGHRLRFMTHADKAAACVVWPPRRVALFPLLKPLPPPALPPLSLASSEGAGSPTQLGDNGWVAPVAMVAVAAAAELSVEETEEVAAATGAGDGAAFSETAVQVFTSAAAAAGATGASDADIERACNQGSDREAMTSAAVASSSRGKSGGVVGAWWVRWATAGDRVAAAVDGLPSAEPIEEPGDGATVSASENEDANRFVDDEQEEDAEEDEEVALGRRAAATVILSSRSSKDDDGGASLSRLGPAIRYSVPTVVLVDDHGVVLKYYAMQKHVATDLGLSNTLVSNCMRGLVPNAKGHRLKAFKEGKKKYTSKVQDEERVANGEFGPAEEEEEEEEAVPRGQTTYSDLLPAGPDHKSKAVVLLDNQGAVLDQYASQKLAAEALSLLQSVVSNCVRGQIPQANGHRLRAFDPSGEYPTIKEEGWADPSSDDEHDDNNVDRNDNGGQGSGGNGSDRKSKAVVLLDNKGAVLEQYASQKLAAKALSLSQSVVSNCVRGQIQKANGHRLRAFDPSGVYPTLKEEGWAELNSDDMQGDQGDNGDQCEDRDEAGDQGIGENGSQCKSKAVVMLDNQGAVLEQYASQTLAAEALGLSQSVVSNCVRGQIQKAKRQHRLRAFDPSGVYPTLIDEGWTEPIIDDVQDDQGNDEDDNGNSEGGGNGSRKAATTHHHAAKTVVLLDDDGAVLQAFASQTKAVEALQINGSLVSNCVRGVVFRARGHRLRHATVNGVYPTAQDEAQTTMARCNERGGETGDEGIFGEGHPEGVIDSDGGGGEAAAAAAAAAPGLVAHHSSKEVVLLDAASGQVVHEFASVRLASEALGVPPSAVSLSINGKAPDAHGFPLRLKHPPHPPRAPQRSAMAAEAQWLSDNARNVGGLPHHPELPDDSAVSSSTSASSCSPLSASLPAAALASFDRQPWQQRAGPPVRASSARARGAPLRYENDASLEMRAGSAILAAGAPSWSARFSHRGMAAAVATATAAAELSSTLSSGVSSGSSSHPLQSVSSGAVRAFDADNSSVYGRAGGLPGLANPHQGPRHRLLLGATVPTATTTAIDPPASAAATAAASELYVASEAALERKPFALARVTTEATSSGDGAGMLPFDGGDDNVASGELPSSNGSPELGVLEAGGASPVASADSSAAHGGAALPASWAQVAAAHAPTHARARELWRFMRFGAKGGARSEDPTSMGCHGLERSDSHVVLPGSVYRARPLAASRLDLAARGTCKVWRLTPVAVRPTSEYSTAASTLQLAPGTTFDFNAKRTEEVLVAGRRRPVTFYRLCLGARGLGAAWAHDAPEGEAWVHDLPPGVASADTNEPLAGYLADKPALLALSEDLGVALVDDAEWEALGEAAGLHLRFTGGECQDAWEQLWHDRAPPGVEVYTSQELKRSMKWGQAARDRSRARGERFEEEDDEGDGSGEDGRRRKRGSGVGSGGGGEALEAALRGAGRFAAAWKPFKCPAPGCLKRYVQRRECAAHPNRVCTKDSAAHARASALASAQAAAARAARGPAAPASEAPNRQEGLSPMDYCDECGSSAHEEQLLICENCVTGWSSDEEEDEEAEGNDDDGNGGDDGGGGSDAAARAATKGVRRHPVVKLRCFGSAHTFCLGLRDVPGGDWFCAECADAIAAQVEAASHRRRANARAAVGARLPAFAAALVGGGGDDVSGDERAEAEAEVARCWAAADAETDTEEDWGNDDEAPAPSLPRPTQVHCGGEESTARRVSRPAPLQASPLAPRPQPSSQKPSAARPTNADRLGLNTKRIPGHLAPLQMSVRKVVVCDDDGKVLYEFETQKECAKFLGISRPAVSCCVTGKNKRANGYRIFPRRPDHHYAPAGARDRQPTGSLTGVAVVALVGGKRSLSPSLDAPSALAAAAGSSASSVSFRSAVSDSEYNGKKTVVLLDTAGSVLRAFASQSKAAIALGLSPAEAWAVSLCVRGKVSAVKGFRLRGLDARRADCTFPTEAEDAAAGTSAARPRGRPPNSRGRCRGFVVSGYSAFTRAERLLVASTLPGTQVSHSELGRRWRALPADRQAFYNASARDSEAAQRVNAKKQLDNSNAEGLTPESAHADGAPPEELGRENDDERNGESESEGDVDSEDRKRPRVEHDGDAAAAELPVKEARKRQRSDEDGGGKSSGCEGKMSDGTAGIASSSIDSSIDSSSDNSGSSGSCCVSSVSGNATAAPSSAETLQAGTSSEGPPAKRVVHL